MCPAILTIPAIIWKLIISDRDERSDRMFSPIATIVNHHMETEGEFYLGEGFEKFHYAFTFRFRNYFLGANVPPEIISLDALVETDIFAKINFIKQGK